MRRVCCARSCLAEITIAITQKDLTVRKVRPQDVRDEFINQVDLTLEHYQRVIIALSSTPNGKLDISILSTTVFHSIFVEFECFISDLFIAYLNSDFSQYQAFFENSVRQSVSEKHSGWLSTKVNFAIPKHLKVEEIAGAIDPSGRNLAFKDCDAMKSKAQNWLAPEHRRAICSISSDDAAIIDTARSIRNWIAHQSKESGSLMNKRLATVEVGHARNANLGRGVKNVTNIGAFLKSSQAGLPRVVSYAARLKDAARILTI